MGNYLNIFVTKIFLESHTCTENKIYYVPLKYSNTYQGDSDYMKFVTRCKAMKIDASLKNETV